MRLAVFADSRSHGTQKKISRSRKIHILMASTDRWTLTCSHQSAEQILKLHSWSQLVTRSHDHSTWTVADEQMLKQLAINCSRSPTPTASNNSQRTDTCKHHLVRPPLYWLNLIHTWATQIHTDFHCFGKVIVMNRTPPDFKRKRGQPRVSWTSQYKGIRWVWDGRKLWI